MVTKRQLESLYKRYNKREFVHPDPLEFLYEYDDVRDREIVGLIASSLAYGRVAQILKSVKNVLDRMGNSPRRYLSKTSEKEISEDFKNFRHRFHACNDISALLSGIRSVIKRHGSLEGCFMSCFNASDENIIPALARFVDEISCQSGCCMLSPPEKGSACKKLNLFLRWMVRNDDVDPGGWGGVPPSKLIVPLDTHMHKISLKMGLTSRKQANMRTAVEITKGFAALAPEDPVRYDFALTRFGIRSDMDIQDLTF